MAEFDVTERAKLSKSTRKTRQKEESKLTSCGRVNG